MVCAIEGRSNQGTYFDRVKPAESGECDEKHQSACDPFCEWVTFGGNRAVLRDRAKFCRAGHSLRRGVVQEVAIVRPRRVASANQGSVGLARERDKVTASAYVSIH